MADNIYVDPGVGAGKVLVATDDVTGVHYPVVKLDVGGDGASTPVSGALPVSDGGGALTVDGAVTVTNATAANLKAEVTIASAQTLGTVSTITNVVHVDDNAGSLTVDGSVTANAGTNLNTSALALEAGGNLAAIKAKTDNIPAQGQALAAASLPVVLTAAQITTLTPPAAITGFATETTLGTRLTESDFDSKAGSLTETAPATDTASSGLNGRLQRIAQRITSLIALLPAALTGSGNLKVAMVESTASQAVTGPLTDTQLRATAVPVSGTVTASGPLTDTQLRATAVPVSLASVPSHAVTNAGTFAVQAAIADGASVTLGAKADAASVSTDTTAITIMQVLKQISASVQNNPTAYVSGAITSAMTSTTSTSLVAAPGANLRNYIQTIVVSNAHATVGTDVIIQDGSGGTTLCTIPAAAVYGGAVVTFPTPLRQPTTNTALYCANVTTGASTKVSAFGYKAA